MKTLKELGIGPAPWTHIHQWKWEELVDLNGDVIADTPMYAENYNNARLISAAPDLYEVVRALVDDFAKAGEMDICTLIGKAEAALKKAGGAE